MPQPHAATAENKAAAAQAATAPDTLATLSRFFARDGKVSRTAAQPRIEGEAIPVNHLSPEFVAGRAGAPVARLEFLASKAVSSDGQQAALWTARTEVGWQVVNIATGDDEFRYAQLGAAKLPGGTVFREPQIDAWYVAGGSRVLPLDEDAVRAVGAGARRSAPTGRGSPRRTGTSSPAPRTRRAAWRVATPKRRPRPRPGTAWRRSPAARGRSRWAGPVCCSPCGGAGA